MAHQRTLSAIPPLGTVGTVVDHLRVGVGRDRTAPNDGTATVLSAGGSRADVVHLLPDPGAPLAVETPLPVGRMSHLPAKPSFLERSLTVLTLFVLQHSTPNTWFLSPDSGTVNTSNPLYVAVIGVLILTGLSRVMGYFNQIINTINLDVAIFGFVGLCLMSTLWSAEPAETLTSALLFAAITAYAFYMVMRYSLEEILVLLSCIFLISGALNLVFVQAFPQYGIAKGGEWSGVLSTKNQLGYLTTLGIPTLLITAMIGRRWRLVCLAGTALLAFLLVMSQSTTALVATILLTVSLPILRIFRASSTLRGAAMLGIFGNGLVIAAVATNQIEVITGWAGKDPSLTGRTPIWEATLDIILERPLIGYGYQAAFGGYFSPAHEIWILNPWEPTDSHNALLQIWIEVGLIGVVLFLAVLARALSNGIRLTAIVPGAVGLWPITMFSLAIVTGISESGIQSEEFGWVMFVIAALAASYHLRHRASLGLSNDLRRAIAANKAGSATR